MSKPKAEYVWGGETIVNPHDAARPHTYTLSGRGHFWKRYMTISAPRSYGRMYWAFKDWAEGENAEQHALGAMWHEAAGRVRYEDYRLKNITIESPTVWL